jgi:hypothetical protein
MTNDGTSKASTRINHVLPSAQDKVFPQIPYEIRRHPQKPGKHVFVCRFPECSGKGSYSRLGDWRRHYEGNHLKMRFWCPVNGCQRYELFLRSDKVTEHAREAHNLKITRKDLIGKFGAWVWSA